MLLPLSRIPELSPNRQALPLIKEFLDRSELLQIKVHKQNGVTVIDCGVQVEGSWEAGILFASVCLGGLAKVKLQWMDFDGLRWPSVEVVTDHPVRACMASQYAGWPIKIGKGLTMGSGPACAIVHKGSLFRLLGYEDHSETAIICLEGKDLPSEEVIQHILEECHCHRENLTILVAPTASLVGSVQVAARALETGLFKLRRLGYDLGKVVSGWGVCPIPPVARDTLSGLGRTNDAIFYGSTVLYNVRDQDVRLEQVVKRVPSCSTQDYGCTYLERQATYKNFFNIDPDQFTPAEIWLCNLDSGRSFHAGFLAADILRKSFGLETSLSR